MHILFKTFPFSFKLKIFHLTHFTLKNRLRQTFEIPQYLLKKRKRKRKGFTNYLQNIIKRLVTFNKQGKVHY